MDLTSHYMGLTLRSPLVVSACTLSEDISNIKKMEDFGAGAVVLFSLFEEQIQKEQRLFDKAMQATTNIFAEALDFFPDVDEYHVGASQYLEHVRRAKEVVNIPIIASLNAITHSGWIDYARQMEEAGADGLEINVYYIPADLRLTAEMVEQRYLDIVKTVKSNISIPVAIKLNPYFSSIAHMAQRLHEEGADALVLFNRFYQPDFDINRLQVLPNLEFSVAHEIRLPLLWIAIIYGRIPVSLAATTGVQSAEEVIKYLLAGADITMTASALYKHGLGHLLTMRKNLELWMDRMNFSSVTSFRGAMSQQHISDPTAYERANYIRILEGVK
ncbi:MAG: dihydroorotate dehydrogenase-like protein [Saprospiraceae bacterium]|nr:dihydroorotate dehydrogenase-like protein [Saprospiraceae bacterium]